MIHKSISYWLYSGIILIFLMVLVGGVTRLTHSGLSIVEWDLFSEARLSFDEQEWNNLFEKYKQSPEYKYINSDFTVSDFKSIFWWEYIHRMLGRLIGFVFIIPYIIFSYKKMISPWLHKRLLIVFILGAFQGFLGWFMVKSGLVDQPSVSHFRLAAHLITAFITCGYIYWITLEVKYKGILYQIPSNIKSITRSLFVLILLQIIWGAFVAGLKAGFTFNTFPKMGDTWFPEQLLPLNVYSITHSVIGVQFTHRYLAYLVVVFAIVLFKFFTQNRTSLTKEKQSFHFFFGLIIIQFLLGVFTIMYSVPIVLGILHQLGAFMLFLNIIHLNFYNYYSNTTLKSS